MKSNRQKQRFCHPKMAGLKAWSHSVRKANSLRNMLKRMVKDSGLETDKKLVNHSTRKHLVQKLVDNDIPPTEIMQITGHKNVASINNYSILSDRKQQQISGVLSGASAIQSGSNSFCFDRRDNQHINLLAIYRVCPQICQREIILKLPNWNP